MRSPARFPSLSVVLAAYNEEDAVIPCAAETVEFLATHVDDWELIVVNDGSTDGTARLIRDFAAHSPRIRDLHLAHNSGMGAALKAGYAAARKEWITMLPADGQIKPREIQKLLAHAADSDVVTSLYDNLPRNPYRRVISLGLRALTALIVGTRAKTEGNYLVRRDLLRTFPLHSDSFLLNLEIPIRAKRGGHRVTTTYISVSPRIAGISKAVTPRRLSQTFADLFRLRWVMTLESLGLR